MSVSFIQSAIKSPHIALACACLGYTAFQWVRSAFESDDPFDDVLSNLITSVEQRVTVGVIAQRSQIASNDSLPNRVSIGDTEPTVSAIARGAGIVPPTEVDPISEGWIVVRAPTPQAVKRVRFELGEAQFTVDQTRAFIFGPLPEGKTIIGSNRIEGAFRILNSSECTGYQSKKELMSFVISLWLDAIYHDDPIRHIPELACKDRIEWISHRDVPDFGSIFNDEKTNYKYQDRHISAIRKFILLTPCSDGNTTYRSISEEYTAYKTTSKTSNLKLLQTLVKGWIKVMYKNDPYEDIPLLRNRKYVEKIQFDDFPNFGSIYLTELDRFRSQNLF